MTLKSRIAKARRIAESADLVITHASYEDGGKWTLGTRGWAAGRRSRRTWRCGWCGNMGNWRADRCSCTYEEYDDPGTPGFWQSEPVGIDELEAAVAKAAAG